MKESTQEVLIEDLSTDEKFEIIFHQINSLKDKLDEEDPTNTKFSCIAYAIQCLIKPESEFSTPEVGTIIRYAQAFEKFVNS